jgi:cytochrome c oxidase subunit 3
MSSATVVHHEEDHSHELSYVQQLKNNRLGLWLFFGSELFLFGALLTARFYLWGGTRPALSQVVGLVATSILLLSSFFVNRAETAVSYDDKKTFSGGMLIASLLGTIFLFSVIVLEWNIFGLEGSIGSVELFGHLKPTDGIFGGVFFIMTGMHAFHVFTGIAFLLIAWNNGRRGLYSKEEHWGVEAAAAYWHYVDVIWVIFYPALYLIGTAVHSKTS